MLLPPHPSHSPPCIHITHPPQYHTIQLSASLSMALTPILHKGYVFQCLNHPHTTPHPYMYIQWCFIVHPNSNLWQCCIACIQGLHQNVVPSQQQIAQRKTPFSNCQLLQCLHCNNACRTFGEQVTRVSAIHYPTLLPELCQLSRKAGARKISVLKAAHSRMICANTILPTQYALHTWLWCRLWPGIIEPCQKGNKQLEVMSTVTQFLTHIYT